MAQEATKEMLAPLEDETLVRPYDTVKIKWVKSSFHKEGATEEVHPLLAKKLIDMGRAELVKKGK